MHRGAHQSHLGATHQRFNVSQEEHALNVAAFNAAHANDAVSYTHLDVTARTRAVSESRARSNFVMAVSNRSRGISP